MSSHREGVNPLRPYYIPPSIGEPADPVAAPSPKPFANATSSGPGYGGGVGQGGRYSKASDLFGDLDYKDYIGEPSPSVVQTLKDLVDELLWKYSVVLMAQPFGVAKTVLQVRVQDDPGSLSSNSAATSHSAPSPLSPSAELADGNLQRRTSSYAASLTMYDNYGDRAGDSDSENDELAYFSAAAGTPTPSRTRSQPHPQHSTHRRLSSPLQSPRLGRESSNAQNSAASPVHQLELKMPDSTRAVIAQLWQKEGAWGVWKGSNATFLYTVLQSLLENWSRSCLCAVFNVPDLGLKDDIDRLVDVASPYPWASLFVAATAAVATGLILAPLDIVRTRLLLTPTSRGPRRTIPTLRSLPSYLCPPILVLPTILHSLVHPLLTLSTPLVLRSRFLIDSTVSPMTFSVAKFCSSFAALFIKLPLETVLRRGQVAVLSSQVYVRAVSAKDQRLDTIVPAGLYKGVFGTMYHIVNEEGSHIVKSKPAQGPTATRHGSGSGRARGKVKIAETVYKKGQGLEGLWRGFGVSWWGLIGLWSVSVVGSAGDGEF